MRRIKLTYNDKRYVEKIPSIHQTLISVFEAKTIYTRFDALCKLVDSCDAYLSQQNIDKKIVSLRQRAFKMAKAIVNAKDADDLNKKRSKREKYRVYDTEYLPWNSPINRDTAFDAVNRTSYLSRSWLVHCINQKQYLFLNNLNYIVDKADKVKYLQGEQREPYRIFPVNSQFMRFRLSNSLDNKYASLCLENFDTEGYAAHAHKGNAIFIVTPKGDMFAGSSEACKFYHSSMVNGCVSTFAGTMKVTRGTLKEIDNRSGHYMPTRYHLIKCLNFFNAIGLMNKNVEATCMSLPDFKREKITRSTINTMKL